MIQKLRYILLILAALVGGEVDVWGQSDVNGYMRTTSDNIVYNPSGNALNNVSNGTLTLSNTTTFSNASVVVSFTFGTNISSWYDIYDDLKISGNKENIISWSVSNYVINVSAFQMQIRATIGGNAGKAEAELSSGTKSHSAKVYKSNVSNYVTLSLEGLSLTSSNNIKLKTYNSGGADYYIQSMKYTYTLSKYTLITTAIDEAITYANGKSPSVADNLVGYLTTAINNANNFKGECSFPNSYWNGSSVGKTPADVTEAANKLKAIADYLVVRTNASVYQQDDIPNEVYRQLHQYDEYDPNGFDSGTINTAKADIEKAITLAANTTETYKYVKSAIATAAARTDHNDVAALEADVTKATNELEAATTVNAINAALSNIKNFDNITFNGPFSVDEGATIDNPANAASGNIVAYSSSDPTVMSVDGTTLRALKPGTVTITAITNTGNGYYAYKASETYIINATAFALDSDEGNLPTVGVEYPTITLNRSLSAICTLALPFDTHISDFSDSPDAYAAQLALVTYNKADGYTLYFMKVDGGHMSANEPYVICLPSTKDSFVWADVTIDSVDPLEKVEGENESFQGWTMQANYTPGVSMEGKYGIVGGKLCLGGAGSTINAYTAYFIPPAEAKGRVRVAMLDNDGTTTYIHSLSDTESDKETTAIYRLDGTKQTTLTKGINIVRMANGEVRKVLK